MRSQRHNAVIGLASALLGGGGGGLVAVYAISQQANANPMDWGSVWALGCILGIVSGLVLFSSLILGWPIRKLAPDQPKAVPLPRVSAGSPGFIESDDFGFRTAQGSVRFVCMDVRVTNPPDAHAISLTFALVLTYPGRITSKSPHSFLRGMATITKDGTSAAMWQPPAGQARFSLIHSTSIRGTAVTSGCCSMHRSGSYPITLSRHR
jgi:hypothetical protein